MIVKSKRKKDACVNIKLTNNDGSHVCIERRNYVKYLGVILDDSLSWKNHISFICTRISRNSGIFLKLRHYLPLKQLKQIYYNLIYPYISYAIEAWGSATSINLKRVQTKQNHIIRIIFFATLYGKDTESAKPLINLLNILTVENIFKLHVLKFVHNWFNNKLPYSFDGAFTKASEMHSYNTRYASKGNLYKIKVHTNVGKQKLTYIAAEIWADLPFQIKTLGMANFVNQTKSHLLSKQSFRNDNL